MSKLLAKALRVAPVVASLFNGKDLVEYMVRDASGQLAVNELVKDSILPDPRARPPGDLIGAGLLRPAYQAVPFQGRAEETRDFLTWCADAQSKLSVRLMTGGSGRGKTRLMVELAGALRDNGPTLPGQTTSDWAAGFIDLRKLSKAPPEDYEGAFTLPFASSQNLFLIVDYAETQAEEHITALLRAGLSAMDEGREALTRIVLISRQRTEVFDTILQDRDLADRSAVTLHDVPLSQIAEEKTFFEAACASLKVPEGLRAFPADVTPDCGLLSFAALLVKTTGKSVEAATDEKILDGVLNHERRYWRQSAERMGVPDNLITLRAQEMVAAALTLYGLQGAIPDEAAAIDLVGTFPQLSDQSYAVKTALVRCISDLYPHPLGFVEGVGLDVLGDHLVTDLAGNTIGTAQSDAQAVSALTRITWLAQRGHQAADALLDTALRQEAERYLAQVPVLAPTLGDPLGQKAAQWIHENGIDPERALRLERELPWVTTTLREFAAVVTSQALNQNGQDEAERASLLNNLANRLSDLGQREAALDAAQEAVALRRKLAEARPEASSSKLAMSLNNLATMLSDLGQPEEALDAAEEAVALYRHLAEARPVIFSAYVAATLNNMANILADLGQREAALDAAQKAVALKRQLVAHRPEVYTPDLATSVGNLANRLADLGLREAALVAVKETVALYRQLTEAAPEAFTPDLARSLSSLAVRLSNVGQREKALDAAKDAVALYRQLAEARPEAFTPNLAASVGNLANMLSYLGQREAALDAAQEAVAFYRQLADERPEAFTPDLAMYVGNLANMLSYLGQREAALDAAKDAFVLYQKLAEERPEAFTPELASALITLANMLLGLGQRESALDAAEESVALYRQLAKERPEAFTPDLALSLGAFSRVLVGLDRKDNARRALHEAVALLTPPFLATPQAFAVLMGQLRRDYLTLCEDLNRDPDLDLLSPIAEQLQALSGGQD